ncbi:hypothetical protein EMPS_06966 [Entomortierella parvispora]|uniref:Small-subunit processome Utp12 domain-containing protein n=1 Tax=Entomortierella parvispora TaxID=205924 RepID=A0A9P3HDQ3_9FUNG|nr:hypothetical protein EMPS_06966 [Entomortierella parvispora]
MPVSVDDPFLLASFTSTTHAHQQNPAVTCTAEGSSDQSGQDDATNLLVVAVQGQGVQLYNTADQKCVLSYSTPPGHSFTGSAQTLRKSAQLRNVYAVIAKGSDIPTKEEGKIVWMWKDLSANADKDVEMTEGAAAPSDAKKTVQKFDRKIHQLFVSSLLPNNIVLTNMDGSISLVTEDLSRVVSTKDIQKPVEVQATKTGKRATKKEKAEMSAAEEHTMRWATTYNTSGSWIPSGSLPRATLVVMTITETSSGKVVASLSYVNEEVRGFSSFGEVEISGATGASGFSFDVSAGHLSFMSAAGQLKVFAFEVSQGDHAVSISETLTLPLPGFAASSTTVKKSSKGDQESTMHIDTLALGDNYLALAGNHQQDGKSELTLTIWDIRYGTLQAKTVIPGTYNAKTTSCQLALLQDSVLSITVSQLQGATVKSKIFFCPFYAEPMSLLGAMGKMRDTAPFLGYDGSLLGQDVYSSTTTMLLTPAHVVGTVVGKDLKEGQDISASLAAERKALEALSSKSTTATVKSFEKVFFDHVDHQTAEAFQDMMNRFGVDAKEVEEAVKAHADKLSQKQKKSASSNAMDIDTEDSRASTKSKKSKASKKERESSAAQRKEEVEGGSSSDDSDEDEEHEPEAEAEEAEEDEQVQQQQEEDEYKVDHVEEDKERLEAHAAAMVAWRKQEAEAMAKYRETRRLLRAGHKPAPLPELSHHFLTTVIRRCFVTLPNGQPDMTFWPAKVIQFLIEKQLVGNSNPGAGQAGIALNLMEREQWGLIELALQKLHDIPEMDMVVMLKQVIGLNKSAATSESLASKTKQDVSTTVPDVPRFLNLVMVAPSNEIFMQQAVKRLTIDELTVVLEILSSWLSIWNERGGIGHQGLPADKKQMPGGLPGYGLVVDMLTLLLDVHFPALILSPQLHPILKTVQKAIQTEADVINQLEQSLRGPLGLFDRKQKDMIRRQKEAELNAAGYGATISGGVLAIKSAQSLAMEKRRRRKMESGQGIPDYGVEIIHM